jgi:uncharacterized protein
VGATTSVVHTPEKLSPLRKSSYLIEIDCGEYFVWINSVTGAIDRIPGEIRNTLTAIDESESWDSICQSLIERGHLTRLTEEQEIAAGLRAWRAIDTTQRQKAHVVICPSMDCNFRCTYCFERALQNRIDSGAYKPAQIHMSAGQAEAVFGSFNALLELHDSIGKSITFFGGEPLWSRNFETVRRTVEIGRDRGFTFTAITNGYQLTAFRTLLGKGGIKMIQVSLDGLPDAHDNFRPLATGGGTFNKIISELKAVIDTPELEVNIRMNYDSRNMHIASLLVKFLESEGILGRSNVHFHGNLISMNHADQGKDYLTLRSYSQTNRHLANCELDCYTSSLRRDLHRAISTGEPFRRRAHFCAATTGMYVFCPDGGIYACWESIGDKHSRLGQFGTSVEWDDAALARWHRRNALAMPRCQSCNHLFFCGGGCAIHAFERTGDLNVSECDGVKQKFASMAKKYFADPPTEKGPLPCIDCACA